MFQLLFFMLIPAIVAVSEGSAFNNTVEITRYVEPANTPHQQAKTPTAEAQTPIDQDSGDAQHKYVDQCNSMEKTFMQMASQHNNESKDSGSWTPLVSMTEPYPITIQGHVTKPFCFRVTFYAPATPAAAFDLLADITRRNEWDELTDTTRVVEKLGQGGDAIHYVKMKPIWPTSARDSVLLARITKVTATNGTEEEEGEEEAFLNVSQSVEDARIPEDPAGAIVRMEAGIAGQLITRAPLEDKERLGLTGDRWCKVVQIADGDLKGWIPGSVLKFVATQALPRSLNKVCNQLAAIPPSSESQLLAQIDKKLAKRALDPHTDLVDHSPPPAASAVTMAQVASIPTGAGNQRMLHHRWSSTSWFKVIVRYATPAIIAAITSIVVSVIFGERRWRRSILKR
ncbi:hypothetical protein EV175_001041 [Coemansia sp. RSA 1933]|nr:hypothetical protein EV175_001041 [Coemansia sp. RSA 1933]